MKLIPQTIVGIEAAAQDLRIAVLRVFGGNRRLLRIDTLEGFAGQSEEDKASTLASYFKTHRLSNLNVYLSLPSACGVVREVELPASVGTTDAIRSAVALQIENLSPWALDEIYWDCSWDPPEKAARSIVVHVGIVPHTVLDPWITLFRSARLALTGASLSSLSWAHGVSALWGLRQPAMVLAAEPGYVEGTLIADGRIYATSMPGSDSAQLVRASASQLMRSGRIESAEQLRIVAHGSVSADADLEPVELPLQAAPTARVAFGAVSAASLGIARSGFGLNLIPPPLRHQQHYLQLVPTYALISLLALTGLAAWLREPYQQSLYAEQLDQAGRRVAAEVRPVADQESRLNRISERLKNLDALLRGRDANLEAMRELSRVLPQGTWLTSYVCQDNVVTIAGLSDSAADIQRLLEDSAVFRDVQFTSSITRDAGGKDRFSLRAVIEARQ